MRPTLLLQRHLDRYPNADKSRTVTMETRVSNFVNLKINKFIAIDRLGLQIDRKFDSRKRKVIYLHLDACKFYF